MRADERASTCPRLEAHRSTRAASMTSPCTTSNMSRHLTGPPGAALCWNTRLPQIAGSDNELLVLNATRPHIRAVPRRDGNAWFGGVRDRPTPVDGVWLLPV